MKFAIVLALCLVIVGSHGKALKNSKIDSILENIPEDEKKEFIKSQVLRGYLMEHEKLEESKLTNEESITLYQYYKENHLIQDNNLLETLGDKICFPNGDCIDTDDPGVYPF